MKDRNSPAWAMWRTATTIKATQIFIFSIVGLVQSLKAPHLQHKKQTITKYKVCTINPTKASTTSQQSRCSDRVELYTFYRVNQPTNVSLVAVYAYWAVRKTHTHHLKHAQFILVTRDTMTSRRETCHWACATLPWKPASDFVSLPESERGGPQFCIPLKLVGSEGYVVIFKEITRAPAIWLEPPYRIKGSEGPRAQVPTR